jgi:hypothetical protein
MASRSWRGSRGFAQGEVDGIRAPAPRHCVPVWAVGCVALTVQVTNWWTDEIAGYLKDFYEDPVAGNVRSVLASAHNAIVLPCCS